MSDQVEIKLHIYIYNRFLDILRAIKPDYIIHTGFAPIVTLFKETLAFVCFDAFQVQDRTVVFFCEMLIISES